MADRVPYFDPSIAHVSLAPSTSKTQRIYFRVIGVGPAFGPANGSFQFAEDLAGMSAAYSFSGFPAPYPYAWPAYNGMWGDNPGWMTVNGVAYIDVTLMAGPTPADGTVVVSFPTGSCTIYVHASPPSDLILDQFVDAYGTWLKNHAPDTAPAGGETGWHGTAGNNKGIIDNTFEPSFTIGGNSGNRYRGRLYAALNDRFWVYADVRREGSGSAAREWGISIRTSHVAGNGDLDLDEIRFLAAYSGAANASLRWQQVQDILAGGADGATIQQEVGFATIAWARWAKLRMLMHVVGATLELWTADEGGANPVLRRTAVLATPWNDSGHRYVGLVYTHLDQGLAYTEFGAFQLTLDVEPGTVTFAALAGGTATAPQLASVFHTPDFLPLGNLSASIAYAYGGAGWLSAVLGSTDCDTDLTLIADPAGLEPGTYHATVTVETPDADAGSPQQVAVTLVVDPLPPAECALDLEVYEEDGTTVAWSVGTDPAHDAPYLVEPEQYEEQEVDFAAGRATIGTVTVTVIDKAQIAGDQDSGYITQRLATLAVPAIAGRRCRLRRYTAAGGWHVVADGRAGVPALSSDYASYSWDIRDWRECERKTSAFSGGMPGTTCILPEGVRGGYRGVGAVTPIRATSDWIPIWMSASDRIFDLTEHYPTGIPITRLANWQALQGNVPEHEARVTWDGKLRAMWREYGSGGAWHEIATTLKYDRALETAKPWPVTVEIDGVVSWDAAEIAEGVQGGADVRAIILTFGDSADVPDIPADGLDCEILIVANAEACEAFPYHVNGVPAGEFLADLYDGVYSPRDAEGALVPSGVRYDAAALAPLTESVYLRVTKPVSDLRDWAERVIYAPLGYAPALDADHLVSPVSQVPPSSVAGLPLVQDADAEPSPDWDAGERIVNLVRIKYPRDYAPTDDEAATGGDGLSSLTVCVEYVDEASIALHGEQLVEYDGSAFRAWSEAGDGSVEDLSAERGWALALERQEYLGTRYARGAPAIALAVRRATNPTLRAGSFALVDLSWFPDYATGRRGLLALGQVLSVGELDCAWRRIMLELASLEVS